MSGGGGGKPGGYNKKEYLDINDLLKFRIYSDSSQEELAEIKVWVTQERKYIAYEDLTDEHLDAIIKLLEAGERTRKAHYKGIKEEKFKRTTKAGKILYGNNS